MKFEDLDKFEAYKRPPNPPMQRFPFDFDHTCNKLGTPMQQFPFDFDHAYNKLRRHDTTISDENPWF